MEPIALRAGPSSRHLTLLLGLFALCAALMVANTAFAGVGGAEFTPLYNTLTGWMTGFLGRVISAVFIFRGPRAADLFPVLAYAPDRHLFFLDDRSLGFGYVCEPLASADRAQADRLSVLRLVPEWARLAGRDPGAGRPVGLARSGREAGADAGPAPWAGGRAAAGGDAALG